MADKEDDKTPAEEAATTSADRYHHVAPWFQAMCVLAIVAMALVNATIATNPIPLTVFALVGALAVGIDPQTFASIFRGGRR